MGTQDAWLPPSPRDDAETCGWVKVGTADVSLVRTCFPLATSKCSGVAEILGQKPFLLFGPSVGTMWELRVGGGGEMVPNDEDSGCSFPP